MAMSYCNSRLNYVIIGDRDKPLKVGSQPLSPLSGQGLNRKVSGGYTAVRVMLAGAGSAYSAGLTGQLR